jgi:hypothetical protein
MFEILGRQRRRELFVCGGFGGQRGILCGLAWLARAAFKRLFCAHLVQVVHGLRGVLYLVGEGDNLWVSECDTPTSLADLTLVPNIKIRSMVYYLAIASIIDKNNNAYVIGKNHRLDLLTDVKVISVDIGGLYSMIVDIENNAWVCEYDEKFIAIPNIKAISVSCGFNHAMIIDMDNNVWVNGSNSIGQLGLGHTNKIEEFTIIPNIKAKFISTGAYHSALINLDDNVWVTGCNDYGQLGLEYNVNEFTIVHNIKAISLHCGFSKTGLIDFENNGYLTDGHSKKFTQIPDMKIASIYSECNYDVVVDMDGGVWVSKTETNFTKISGFKHRVVGDRFKKTKLARKFD